MSSTPHRVEAEYENIAKQNAWPIVYQKVGRQSQSYAYTCTEAKKPQNKPLNRYRDVNPYDHSRVVLKRCDTDYINANLVTVKQANRRYILTQGPLPSTVSHFWAMIWEQESHAILMLNKIIEKNEMKCHHYWPSAVGPEHALKLEDVNLTVELTEEQDSDNFVVRRITISDSGSKGRPVVQFHYTTWPDFGVPSSPDAFLKFLERVRASGALEADKGPAVVHCSAGIGRSGTFCLVDSCLVMIETHGVDSVNIVDMLLEMRKDRMGLIQTPDQLRFSYQAIIEGTKRIKPDFKEEGSKIEESIYSAVAEEEEEAPPPPPPRGESLSRPPVRPLPAIPKSISLGNLAVSGNSSSSPSESTGPTVILPPIPSPSSSTSSDIDDDELLSDNVVEPISLRRRRAQQELAERVSEMKRKAQEADKWHELKRSFYKPLSITLGVLIAGMIFYAYAKH